MRHFYQLLLSFALLSLSFSQQADDNYPNCVFVGCSCGDDADMLIASSKEEYTESVENLDIVSAQSLSYDITCKDESNPAFKFRVFPERDLSRRYSYQVTTLEIAQNELREIPADRFNNLEISMADFSRNLISQLSDNAFRGIRKLELLDLSLNELDTLSKATFEPIKGSLIQLKLNHNKLNKMTASQLSSVLSILENLKSLTIRHNALTQLPDLKAVGKLEELSVAYNLIESLNDETSGEPLLPDTLIDLSIEHNRIKHISEKTFANLINLKYLNLESNQITSISDGAFNRLTRLLHLNLGKNYLKQIPSRVFFTLVNLERIDLSAQNQMLKIVENYAFDRESNSRTIKKIDLSKNRIIKIDPRAFCSLNTTTPFINVKEIDLANNPLQSMNACSMRQLNKGFSEHHKHHTVYRHLMPKVSFKPTHFHEKLTPSLKCDCEITKSAHYVDLEGDCENSANVLVPLKQFKCNEDAMSEQETEADCLKQVEFDCTNQKDFHTTKSFINDKLNDNNKNNNNKQPIRNNEYDTTSQREKADQMTKRPAIDNGSTSNKTKYSILLAGFFSLIQIFTILNY